MADLLGQCPACFEPTATLPCALCGFAGDTGDSDDLPIGLGMAGGQYLIGRILGRGNFGTTYLGWDSALATKVAIKEFLPNELATRAEDRLSIMPLGPQFESVLEYARGRFRDEAQRLARFNHVNIVRVRAFFEEHHTGYLVMDYYEGCTLDDELRERAQRGEVMRESEAVLLIAQVLRGLQALHEPRDGADPLVHRDIKPANVYLARIGRTTVPILLDFGAARVAVNERTKNLTTIFTAGYAPFEQQVKSGRQGPWTDVYACAATLYHMVTGATPPSSLLRKEGEPLRPVRELNAQISQRVADAIERGLALDPQDRPQSARDFLALLGADATTRGGQASRRVKTPADVPSPTPVPVQPAVPQRYDDILTHARAGNIKGIDGSMAPDDVRRLVDQGWRFVQFVYCLSFVLSTRRKSIVHFCAPDEPAGAGYTFVTILFGWWGLPNGPSWTLEAIRVNRGGGIDVTRHVLDEPNTFFLNAG